MTRLVITEKEKMALNIARALGSYSKQSLGYLGKRRVNTYEVAGTEGNRSIILPLSGHVMNYVTRRDLERWTHDSVDRILNDPKSLVKTVSSRGYYSAIRNLAEKSSEVIIATDSDEEGENIGLEVTEILGGYSKPIKRLWLTTTIPSDIRRAFSSLREFNLDLALSVEARRKIDAAVGFAGTREVTLCLRFSVAGGRGVLSFGRVQTSTLWIVIRREREIQSFIPKAYLEITADVENTRFMHSECPIFDREHALEIYNRIKNEKEMLCTFVHEETEYIQPPKPLNTAELLRAGSNLLHVSPSRVLSLAEELYLEGKITYPRVDNQTYTTSFDNKANLEKLVETKYGEYVRLLLQKNLTTPTRGRFSEDHEPITPIAAITEFSDPLAYRLYEVILRHYLSIFGPAAKFTDTTVRGTIKNEPFNANGRRLIDAGFYQIYYYPSKEKPIDQFFKPNTTYPVNSIDVTEKKTMPPLRYTESNLLAEMEREGIGTKSTRPLMIDTLRRRAYVRLQRQTVYPTERGMKFIASIERPWGDYISPQFTARVESAMEKIAEGKRNWEEIVDSERRSFGQVVGALRKHK